MSEERIIVKITFEDYEKKSIEWARTYANDIATIEKMVLESKQYRYCIGDFYKRFVKENKLVRIELLDDDKKKDLYNKSKELFPDAPTELRRELCIFIHLMNHLFEKYFNT